MFAWGLKKKKEYERKKKEREREFQRNLLLPLHSVLAVPPRDLRIVFFCCSLTVIDDSLFVSFKPKHGPLMWSVSLQTLGQAASPNRLHLLCALVLHHKLHFASSRSFFVSVQPSPSTIYSFSLKLCHYNLFSKPFAFEQ